VLRGAIVGVQAYRSNRPSAERAPSSVCWTTRPASIPVPHLASIADVNAETS
jgi:hypothetical protein